MNQVSLSGQDLFSLNNYVFTGFADEDYVDIRFPNAIANAKIGKNGNAIYGFNAQGALADVAVRVLRGSPDDKFLNGLLAQQQANFSAFVLMIGQYAKKLGDGQGNITSDTYILSGGIFVKIPEGKSNSSGSTDQTIAMYSMQFTSAPRVLT